MCGLGAGAGSPGHASGTACRLDVQVGHNMCERGLAGQEEAQRGGTVVVEGAMKSSSTQKWRKC
jgi:hypothetical protein